MYISPTKAMPPETVLEDSVVRIKAIYVRYFKAFNFDHIRKHDHRAEPDRWDLVDDDRFFPYVKVDLDEAVTCIVGANESGKSQLLSALEHALTGEGVESTDFCRYSVFFGVNAAMRTPHFGLALTDLSDVEMEDAKSAAGAEAQDTFSVLRIFRQDGNQVSAYFDERGPFPIEKPDALQRIIPKTFRIDPAIPIPNSVPISYLAGGDPDQSNGQPDRSRRWAVLVPFVENLANISAAVGQPEQLSAAIGSVFSETAASSRLSNSEEFGLRETRRLAFHLLVTVGGINPSAFRDLEQALRREDEGFANGIVAAMNAQLSHALNLRKWWTQDDHFELQIAARDFDLVFTVKDRTASEYSFRERSSGLKYFLSYLVQYLTIAAAEDCPQVLLMDEPDAFLSNQGQQDLLRLFQDFADRPEDQRQVVFVTHSPFLIDKNRADRIRVLDKGAGDEGTRVVRNVGHNHFEPLRSALGGFVGETTFIGNCNLMVEGISDQILLAGMSNILRSQGRSETERIDLNSVTIVPAGSASHIPYMVFLARGRDSDQPAVVVLLDGDNEGDLARKALRRGGPYGKQLLDSEFVVQLGIENIPDLVSERPGGPVDIEDLVPVEIAILAAKAYLNELGVPFPDPPIDPDTVRTILSESVGIFESIQKCLADASSEIQIEKVGFARHIVSVAVHKPEDAEALTKNFATLNFKLGECQRSAVRRRAGSRVRARIDRLRAGFLRDFKTPPTRADVRLLLEDIESGLDSTLESDRVLLDIRRIREEFHLDEDLAQRVEEYDELRSQLEGLEYQGVLASQPEAFGQSSAARSRTDGDPPALNQQL
jgi:predicted ATP-dependent endonuclease of OLD family